MKILFTLLIALSASFSIAQTQFTIQDADTQKPLEKVLIRVNDKSFFSDQEGKVQIPFSEPISAIFFLEGYETIQGNFEPGSYILRLKSLSYSLSDFTVTAFETERPLLKQSAAISLVGEQDFSRFNETSIVNSFNTKPGVRIEERALASYRVSIRGSSLRAPFGVRNVKIYWNDVPFTAPDGTTALNLLDLSNIRTAEVIKGPSGSIYGAGNGGVINLKSPADPKGGLVSAEYGGGSFGLNRSRIAISQQVGKGGFEASLVKQKLDGYREHSAMD